MSKAKIVEDCNLKSGDVVIGPEPEDEDDADLFSSSGLLEVELCRNEAQPPQRCHEGDAGLDLFSCSNIILEAGRRRYLPLGIRLKFPKGHYGRITGRSGLARLVSPIKELFSISFLRYFY